MAPTRNFGFFAVASTPLTSGEGVTAAYQDLWSDRHALRDRSGSRIEQLIDQVRFNADIPSEEMRHEQLGKFRLVMERTHHSGLIEPHYFGLGNCGHRRNATRLAGQAAFTKEIPLFMESDPWGGDIHMYRTSLIACILTLACFFLTPSLGSAQTDKVKTSIAALKAETGKLGAPKVQGNDLYFGTTKAANDLVDAVAKANGGAASLFVKKGDQYVRVATTLKKADGTSAVGTPMDAKNPAMAKLNNGEAFYGDAPVLGKTYDTGYEPIKDASDVIGAYFVGYPK